MIIKMNYWTPLFGSTRRRKKKQRLHFSTSLHSIGSTFFLVGIFLSMMSTAINPGCRCVRFTSTYGKEWGGFTSPDYPRIYPAGIRCLLYSFQAPKDYIVHLLFAQIHLPSSTQSNGCFGGDYLKLFVHLDEEGVNELTPWNRLVCGQIYNQSFYSSSRNIILQFHSTPHRPISKSQVEFGFFGKFRFLNSSQFESQGRLVPGSKCDYQFISANYTASHGRFFSPLYPSTYPHNIQCSYHFHASLHERVKIVFETVALQTGEYSCLNKTDVIRALDGSTAKSPVIALICNSVKELEILSSGPNMQIEFISNSENPGNGFRAKYYFVKVQLDQSYDAVHLFQHQGGLGSDLSTYGIGGLPQASTLVPQCNHVITSDAGRNGSFTSPNYPHPYPAKTHCRYDLIGHGRERVQIVFVDFNLYHPEEVMGSKDNLAKLNKYKSCGGTDTLSVFVYTESNLARIDSFCGSNIPLAIMSNSHKLTLELKYQVTAFPPQSSRHARGFHAHYFFLEDYGIRSGRQLSDYPCAFVFNSSESPNGTFTSPNYPGLYPRDTECHYFFHAREGEHVEISFSHFHVDGVEPCEEDTHSDSVEFSNFMPVDDKFQRHCGPIHDLRVRSDGNFFRVTFRSNFKYDATGFHAGFHFTDQITQHTVRNSRSTAAVPHHHDHPPLHLFNCLSCLFTALCLSSSFTNLALRM